MKIVSCLKEDNLIRRLTPLIEKEGIITSIDSVPVGFSLDLFDLYFQGNIPNINFSEAMNYDSIKDLINKVNEVDEKEEIDRLKTIIVALTTLGFSSKNDTIYEKVSYLKDKFSVEEIEKMKENI